MQRSIHRKNLTTHISLQSTCISKNKRQPHKDGAISYGTAREPAHYHLWSVRNEVKPVYSATDRFGIPADQ